MQKNKQTSDKPIYKKWWFWVIIVVILGVIGLATQGATETTDKDGGNNNGDNSQNVGTLPTLNESDYLGKEGLVVFKDLVARGYTVTVEFVNEAVPAANRDLTETFTNSDANNPEDRQAFDAWLVKTVTQDGGTIHLTIG